MLHAVSEGGQVECAWPVAADVAAAREIVACEQLRREGMRYAERLPKANAHVGESAEGDATRKRGQPTLAATVISVLRARSCPHVAGR